MPVTTRNITFLVGNPELNLSCATVTLWEVDPTYTVCHGIVDPFSYSRFHCGRRCCDVHKRNESQQKVLVNSTGISYFMEILVDEI